MLCRRHLTRKKCILTSVCLLFLYLVRSVVLVWYYDNCTMRQSVSYIYDLCEEYYKGSLTGNMCPYLCESEEVVFVSCLNYVGGKETYLMQWGVTELIMKSKKPRWQDYQRFTPPGSPVSTLESLLDFLVLTLKDTFGASVEATPDLLHRYWFVPKGGISKTPKDRNAVIESIWSLFQQDEYVTIQFYKKSKFMPLMYGTCGHFYFIEYLPSGKLLLPTRWPFKIFDHENTPWRSRVVLALYLLELVRSLESDFQSPVHICDTKGDNFGRSADGAVKLVDVDMTLSDSKLLQLFTSFNCAANADCYFFDCQANCDTTSNACVPERTNSNVQVLCMKIFKSHMQNGYSGLLDGAPVQIYSEINEMLRRCSSSTKEESNFLTEDLFKLLNSHLYAHLLPQHNEN